MYIPYYKACYTCRHDDFCPLEKVLKCMVMGSTVYDQWEPRSEQEQKEYIKRQKGMSEVC